MDAWCLAADELFWQYKDTDKAGWKQEQRQECANMIRDAAAEILMSHVEESSVHDIAECAGRLTNAQSVVVIHSDGIAWQSQRMAASEESLSHFLMSEAPENGEEKAAAFIDFLSKTSEYRPHIRRPVTLDMRSDKNVEVRFINTCANHVIRHCDTPTQNVADLLAAAGLVKWTGTENDMASVIRHCTAIWSCKHKTKLPPVSESTVTHFAKDYLSGLSTTEAHALVASLAGMQMPVKLDVAR